jgi:hypothetical protein
MTGVAFLSFVALGSFRENAGTILSYQQGQNFGRYELIGRKGNNEDTNIDSDIGLTVTGVRPDNGAATVAGAVEGNANDCAGENEEDAP